MSETFVGQVILFAGNFPPRGYAFCNGQLMPISQNTALFSLLGTNYGGNGTSTFALPDLRSRAPLHAGNGSQAPGLSPYQVGEQAGSGNRRRARGADSAALAFRERPHDHGQHRFSRWRDMGRRSQSRRQGRHGAEPLHHHGEREHVR